MAKNTTLTLLFELLNRSLAPNKHIQNGEPLTTIGRPDRKAWLSLITLAERNEVSGLLYDSVLTLPQEQQPDFEVMMRWTASIQSLERDNLLYRKHLGQVFELFERQMLSPILMKGLTLSELYPNPLHRPVGDVDLYVPIDQLNLVVQYLQSMGGEVETQFDTKHHAARCNGLNWELHFRTHSFYSSTLDRRYRLFELEETSPENLLHIQIGEHHILHFPPLLNIIYLTAHFEHHLLMERITIRQVIDWSLTLHHERTALGIAETNLVRILQQLGLYRLYRALGYIAIHHLGYSATGYAGLTRLTAADARRANIILYALLKGHIHGCRPYQPHLVNDNYLTRLLHYLELCKRCVVLFRLFPKEAFFTPFGFLRNAITRRL